MLTPDKEKGPGNFIDTESGRTVAIVDGELLKARRLLDEAISAYNGPQHAIIVKEMLAQAIVALQSALQNA